MTSTDYINRITQDDNELMRLICPANLRMMFASYGPNSNLQRGDKNVVTFLTILLSRPKNPRHHKIIVRLSVSNENPPKVR